MEEAIDKIFVVDDEPNNFEVIEILLSREPYELVYLKNAAEFWLHLEQELPDVILLDVMMPQVNGMEVCQALKASAQWKHIPVVMVTSLSSKEDLGRCIEAGADDFISKPVNGIELRSRVRSMLRIKKQQDALKDALQLRQDLVHMIVHDLRNPLANIVLSGDLLQMTQLNPKQAQKIEHIQLSCRQLQTMIDGLLMTAQLESGKLQLNRTPADLTIIGQQVIDDFEAIANQKFIQLIVDFPQAGVLCDLDEVVFRRILDNLFSNAIKFSPKGSCITLSVEYSTTMAKLRVIDEGRGIQPELRQKIFQKFEVGEFNEEVNQIGLGLAFCKMAIEAHGGTIAVEANYPAGTIFVLEIPLETPEKRILDCNPSGTDD
jgi:two-component system, sensor histidine kinase and response regulator